MVAPLAALPVPASREAADSLLREMGRLKALEARNAADYCREELVLKAKYDARNNVTVPGLKHDVPIADGHRLLGEAVAAYAEAHKDELIDAKRKSVKLNFGTLGWKKALDKLEPVDDQSAAGRAALLDRLHAFEVEALQEFTELSAEALACLHVQVKWRMEALLNAKKDKKIDAEELRKIGFKFAEGVADSFYCKPDPAELTSQPASAA